MAARSLQVTSSATPAHSITTRTLRTTLPIRSNALLRERQKVGGQAALRSGSCVCGCDLNFGYQRRNRRLHECRANRFPLPSTLAEVRDELAVIADVCFSKSAALANGLKDAHFVSRYSISGLVCPLSQVLIGRNVWGPSVWRAHRFPLVRSSFRERAGGVEALGGADPDRILLQQILPSGGLAPVDARLLLLI